MGATSIAPDGSTVLLMTDVSPGNFWPVLVWPRGRLARGFPIYADPGGCHLAIRGSRAGYCPAASAPRVRGSGAPSSPFAVTAIELAEVWPIGSPTTVPTGPHPARPAVRRQSRVRSALRPAAIDGAGAGRPPRRPRPCDSRAH